MQIYLTVSYIKRRELRYWVIFWLAYVLNRLKTKCRRVSAFVEFDFYLLIIGNVKPVTIWEVLYWCVRKKYRLETAKIDLYSVRHESPLIGFESYVYLYLMSTSSEQTSTDSISTSHDCISPRIDSVNLLWFHKTQPNSSN